VEHEPQMKRKRKPAVEAGSGLAIKHSPPRPTCAGEAHSRYSGGHPNENRGTGVRHLWLSRGPVCQFGNSYARLEACGGSPNGWVRFRDLSQNHRLL
jgi:hypothetical protein